VKIKFLSGPRAGQTSHVPNSQEYQVMASAGLIEIVPMAARGSAEWLRDMKERSEALNPPVQPKVTWSVGKGDRNGRYFISAKCSNPQCSEFFYDGAPNSADKLTFVHSCSGTAPERIPVEVSDQYRKLFKLPALGAELPADEAAFHYAARPQPSRPVDLYAPQKNEQGDIVGPPILGGHPVDPKHSNYGIGNFQPSPGDGQKADLSKLSPVFKK
jgi:hypothetical protein